MNRFDRIEAARLARDPRDLTAHVQLPDGYKSTHRTGFLRTDFAVGKLYDDGRFEPLHTNMTRDTAEALAGMKRDASTDDQVKAQLAEGWTWAYRAQGGNTRGKNGYGAPKKVAPKRYSALSTGMGKRSARPTP